MAYVLGFFAADGNMCIHKNGGKYLEFTSCDKGLLIMIKNLIRANNKISTRDGIGNRRSSYRIQLGSKEMFQDLLKLGMVPTKSLTLKFPYIHKEHLGDFIRGHFDGDGSISVGKYWRKDRSQWKWEITSRSTSGSRNFLEGLRIALRPYCAGGYIYKKNRGFELVFSRHDSLALSSLMYHNIRTRPYLERKHAKFQSGFRKLKYLGA